MSAVPHLRSLPGGRRPDAVVPGRSHVTNLRPQHPTTTRVVFLTDLEASVAVAYLRQATSQAVRDVADVIDDQWKRPAHPSMQPADECDPHGIPRPGAS